MFGHISWLFSANANSLNGQSQLNQTAINQYHPPRPLKDEEFKYTTHTPESIGGIDTALLGFKSSSLFKRTPQIGGVILGC